MSQTMRSIVLLVPATALLCALGGATAQPNAANGGTSLSRAVAANQPPAIFFALHEDSAYVYGCFPAPPFACAGPVFFQPDFSGHFAATFTGIDEEGFSVYELSGIDLVAGSGPDAVHIEGSGLYRRTFGSRAQQEMMLDVTLDGSPTAFDSGVVSLPDGSTNFVDVSVNMNDLQNYDIVLEIVANPSPGKAPVSSLAPLLP